MPFRKFGAIAARDCKGLTIRLPSEVWRRIEVATGVAASKWLCGIALEKAGMSFEPQSSRAQKNRAQSCARCGQKFHAGNRAKYCSESCKQKAKRARAKAKAPITS